MTATAGSELLSAECRAFSRYLIRQDPTDYVSRCYQAAWPTAAIPAGERAPLIDAGLLALARRGRGGVLTRIADAYARRFRPYAELRRRLILLLAILENSPGSAANLGAAREGSWLGSAARMGLTLLSGGGCLIAGMILLGPLHLLGRLAPRKP